MSNSARFSVSVAPDLPADEREGLMVILRTYTQVEEFESRDVATAWTTFVAVMKDAGEVIGTISTAAVLAEKIISWLREVRKHRMQPKVHFERPHQPGLDLDKASDEEILAWFLQKPPKH